MTIASNRSDKERIEFTIGETYTTVGNSQLAASITRMLQQYIDTNQEDSTLTGALKLLDNLKAQCTSARSDISSVLDGGESGDLDLAGETIQSTLAGLRERFGASFSQEGAKKAMGDMARWIDALKKDLELDSKK